MIFLPRAGEHNLLKRCSDRLTADRIRHELFDELCLRPAGGRLRLLRVFYHSLLFFIVELRADDPDALTLLPLDAEFEISGDVLAEVQHISRKERRLKALVFRHGHIVGGAEFHIFRSPDDAGTACIGGLHRGVVHLAVLEVRKADRAVVGPAKGAVRPDRLPPAVGVGDLKLGKETGLRPEDIGHPVGCEASAEPAVRKAQFKGVHFPDVLRHVVRLHLDPFVVVRRARRKDKILDALSVDGHIVDAASRRIKPSLFDLPAGGKLLFKAVDGIAALRIRPVIPADPACGPVIFREKPQFKGAFADLSGLVIFIPELHAPLHRVAAFQHLSLVGNVRHGGTLHFSAVPDGLVPAGADDPIARLCKALLTVPVEARIRVAEPQGLM